MFLDFSHFHFFLFVPCPFPPLAPQKFIILICMMRRNMLHGSSRIIFISMQETLSKRGGNIKGVINIQQLTQLRELQLIGKQWTLNVHIHAVEDSRQDFTPSLSSVDIHVISQPDGSLKCHSVKQNEVRSSVP